MSRVLGGSASLYCVLSKVLMLTATLRSIFTGLCPETQLPAFTDGRSSEGREKREFFFLRAGGWEL